MKKFEIPYDMVSAAPHYKSQKFPSGFGLRLRPQSEGSLLNEIVAEPNGVDALRALTKQHGFLVIEGPFIARDWFYVSNDKRPFIFFHQDDVDDVNFEILGLHAPSGFQHRNPTVVADQSVIHTVIRQHVLDAAGRGDVLPQPFHDMVLSGDDINTIIEKESLLDGARERLASPADMDEKITARLLLEQMQRANMLYAHKWDIEEMPTTLCIHNPSRRSPILHGRGVGPHQRFDKLWKGVI